MLITGVEVTDDPDDHSQLVPMLRHAEEATKFKECALRGQKAVMPEAQDRALGRPYHKDRFAYDQQTDSYICPQGQQLRFTRLKRTSGIPMRLYRASGAVCRGRPAFGVCTRDGRHGKGLEIGPHDTALRRHRAWMSTEKAMLLYTHRKQLVEPVFGIIKEQRAAHRFLLRGLANVAAEWALLATAFNLRTLWRAWRCTITPLWPSNLIPSLPSNSIIGQLA